MLSQPTGALVSGFRNCIWDTLFSSIYTLYANTYIRYNLHHQETWHAYFADIWWNVKLLLWILWISICDKANLNKNVRRIFLSRCKGFRPSVGSFFFALPFFPVPSDSFLISKVTSCDTSTVTHPLFLPLSQPGCPMSEGLVIYRVTSWWRGMQAMGKETLKGRYSREFSVVPYSDLAIFWGMLMRSDMHIPTWSSRLVIDWWHFWWDWYLHWSGSTNILGVTYLNYFASD